MSSRSEIFPEETPEREPAVRHLADVVTIARKNGQEPAHMDLIALANVIVRSEAQITELALAVNTLNTEIMRLNSRVEKLERRDGRMMDLIRSITSADEYDDED